MEIPYYNNNNVGDCSIPLLSLLHFRCVFVWAKIIINKGFSPPTSSSTSGGSSSSSESMRKKKKKE
jgi:hypothetical protein